MRRMGDKIDAIQGGHGSGRALWLTSNWRFGICTTHNINYVFFWFKRLICHFFFCQHLISIERAREAQTKYKYEPDHLYSDLTSCNPKL